jgi:hypothetical protein
LTHFRAESSCWLVKVESCSRYPEQAERKTMNKLKIWRD